MNRIGSYFILAAALLVDFFPDDPVAQAIGTFFTKLGGSLKGTGGTIPAFDLGDYVIGPIEVKKKGE